MNLENYTLAGLYDFEIHKWGNVPSDFFFRPQQIYISLSSGFIRDLNIAEFEKFESRYYYKILYELPDNVGDIQDKLSYKNYIKLYEFARESLKLTEEEARLYGMVR